LVLRPQFFKSLRPSKVKTKTKTALAKTKISKNGLKTKTGLKDYITGHNTDLKLSQTTNKEANLCHLSKSLDSYEE